MLAAGSARQQRSHCLLRRDLLKQNSTYRLGDRRLDLMLVGDSLHDTGTAHALYSDPGVQQLLQLAPGNGQTDLPIAREIACRREHQIPQACQPHKGFWLPAQGIAHPLYFSQPPGNQGCTGVIAQRQPVTNSTGNGYDVFQCPPNLDPEHILPVIDAGLNTMKNLDTGLRQRLTGRGKGQGDGEPLSDLQGKGGTRQGTGMEPGGAGQLTGPDGLGQPPGVRVEALAGGEGDRGTAALGREE